MRVMIVGARGKLGSELVPLYASDHKVTELTSAECDISSYESVMSTVYAAGPELIINAAAMADVDGCETDQDRAFAVNAIGPRNLALAARELNADLVHISTDYVFDGNAGRPYDEWDQPNPLSVYGRSKLGGEREIQTLHNRSSIVRTAVLLSTTPPNFALSILKRAQGTDDEMPVVSDQIGSPTYIPHLARTVRQLSVSGRYGLYHVAGGGGASRADLARELLAQSGGDPTRIVDITSESITRPGIAPRPHDSTLDGRALRLSGFAPMPSWQQGVADLCKDLSAV